MDSSSKSAANILSLVGPAGRDGSVAVAVVAVAGVVAADAAAGSAGSTDYRRATKANPKPQRDSLNDARLEMLGAGSLQKWTEFQEVKGSQQRKLFAWADSQTSPSETGGFEFWGFNSLIFRLSSLVFSFAPSASIYPQIGGALHSCCVQSRPQHLPAGFHWTLS